MNSAPDLCGSRAARIRSMRRVCTRRAIKAAEALLKQLGHDPKEIAAGGIRNPQEDRGYSKAGRRAWDRRDDLKGYRKGAGKTGPRPERGDAEADSPHGCAGYEGLKAGHDFKGNRAECH